MDEKMIFLAEADAMYEELRRWRANHPEASFDEIAEQVTPRRRVLMGRLLKDLATQDAEDRYVEAVCPDCGQVMEASGQRSRTIIHSEGDVKLERSYRLCRGCGQGIFPPGSETASA